MKAQIIMRCCIIAAWDKEIVATIQRVLSQGNPFFEMFLRAGEFIRKQKVVTKLRESICEPIIAQLCKDVAAILLDDNIGAERNSILHQRGGVLQQISDRRTA
jgi:hypothetical protein